jgi:MFS family permease
VVPVLREAVASRDLRRFQLGCAFSALALWGFTVALAIAAYREGGATAVGAATLTRTLPSAAVSPLSAWLGDRRSRRGSVIVMACGSSLGFGGLAIAVGAHAGLLALLLLTVPASIFATSGRLAQAAMLPGLTRGPRQLAAANGLWNAIENGGFLAGALVVGLAVSLASVEVAFVIFAVICAATALVFSTVAPDETPEHRTSLPGATVTRELLLGGQEILSDVRLRGAVALITGACLVDGLLDVILVVVALKLVSLGAGGVGWLNGMWGVGGLAGGLAAVIVLRDGRFDRAIAAGALVLAVGIVLPALVVDKPVALVGFAVFGGGYAIVDSATQTLVQRFASDEALARVLGTVESAGLLASGVGAIAAPGLIALVGIRASLVVAALLLPLVVLAYRSRAVGFDVDGAVPLVEFGLLRGLDIFAPLPLATVENLAIHAKTESVYAGTPIIRRGEIGDRFYAILEGEVAVRRADGSTVTEAEGDYFGEIALVNRVPRTADVTATRDCRLLTVAGDLFLLTVTGQARAQHTAQAVAEIRSTDPNPA